MESELKDRLRDMVADLSPDEMELLDTEFQMARIKARRSDTLVVNQGTPKDAAVQLAARWAFEYWRDPNFRRHVQRTLPDQPLTYKEIGEILRVSKERVRMLFKQLVPFLYDIQYKEQRRQA